MITNKVLVCVIGREPTRIISIKYFDDSSDGNEMAEQEFLAQAKHHISDWDTLTQEEIDECLEDGFVENKCVEIIIQHT